MTKEYLFCVLCGNLLEMTTNIKEEVICCGEPMKVVTANTTDAAVEKHVPVINIEGNKVMITVGEIPHPMEENHYIKWIYLQTNKKIYKKSLNPGNEPKVEFTLEENEEVLNALAYCNLHGLWLKENK